MAEDEEKEDHSQQRPEAAEDHSQQQRAEARPGLPRLAWYSACRTFQDALRLAESAHDEARRNCKAKDGVRVGAELLKETFWILRHLVTNNDVSGTGDVVWLQDELTGDQKDFWHKCETSVVGGILRNVRAVSSSEKDRNNHGSDEQSSSAAAVQIEKRLSETFAEFLDVLKNGVRELEGKQRRGDRGRPGIPRGRSGFIKAGFYATYLAKYGEKERFLQRQTSVLGDTLEPLKEPEFEESGFRKHPAREDLEEAVKLAMVADDRGRLLATLLNLIARPLVHLKQESDKGAQIAGENQDGGGDDDDDDDDDEITKNIQNLVHVYGAVSDEFMAQDNVDKKLLKEGVAAHLKYVMDRNCATFLTTISGLPAKDTDRLLSTWIFRSLLEARYQGSTTPFYVVFRDFSLLVALVIFYSWLAGTELAADKGGRPSTSHAAFLLIFPLNLFFTYSECREIYDACRLTKDRKWWTELWDDLQDRHRSALAPFVVWPLVMLYCPRSYVEDPWNWIDVSAFLVVWIVVFWTYANPLEPGAMDRYFADDRDEEDTWGEMKAQHAIYSNFVTVGVLLLWLKLIGLFRRMSARLAAFVYMLVRVLTDLELFLFVLVGVFIAFTNVFYLRLSRRRSFRFDYDASSSNPFRTIRSSIATLYLTGVLGDIEQDDYPREGDVIYMTLFIFIVTLVLMNVVIAIVSTAYEDALASGAQVFWRVRLMLVSADEDVAADEHKAGLSGCCRWRQIEETMVAPMAASVGLRIEMTEEALAKILTRQLGFVDDADDSEDTLSFRRLRRCSVMLEHLTRGAGSAEEQHSHAQSSNSLAETGPSSSSTDHDNSKRDDPAEKEPASLEDLTNDLKEIEKDVAVLPTKKKQQPVGK